MIICPYVGEPIRVSWIGPGEFMQETTMFGDTPDGNGGLIVNVDGTRKL